MHHGVEPEIRSPARAAPLALQQARHPMLVHFLGWEKVVPLDLHLEPGTEILVISGPNTGGKTAALKTLGLLAAMAQTGFHLPATSAILPLFVKVRADIGDHQSLQERSEEHTSELQSQR